MAASSIRDVPDRVRRSLRTVFVWAQSQRAMAFPNEIEHRLRQLMDAAVPVLLEMLREYVEAGNDPRTVAGSVIDATAGAQAYLVPRERAHAIAEQVAPDHAHLLEGPAPHGRFTVVAVAGDTGAVVELGLPDSEQYGGEA